MIEERDCLHCKHHTEQGCSSWSCEFEPRMSVEKCVTSITENAKQEIRKKVQNNE